MKTSTLTVKGQVTVPKELRDAFGWEPGDRVAFVLEEDGVKIVSCAPGGRGREVVARLRGARWASDLSTDRLLALTRGGRRR